jgi:thiol-disulfide isomerase/thioredoxin
MRLFINSPLDLLFNPLSFILPLFLLVAVACGEAKTEETETSAEQESTATMPADNDDVPVDKIESAVFTDWDGNEVKISDFRGKTVLIDFWETWCGPCLNAMPALDKLMDDYPDDFVVIAVSPGWSDTEEAVRRFIDEHDYDFVFVHDEELATALEIRGIPYKVYVDPQGKYIKNETGSRGPDREYELISEIIESNR